MPVKTKMKRMIQRACELSGLLDDNPDFILAVNFVDTRTICRLNRQFVGHEGPTDVISFNYGTDSSNDIDAELFICTDTAENAAKRLKRSFSDEVSLYIIHGILHISGEEDSTASERKRMRRLEQMVLSNLGRTFDSGEIFPERRK